MREVIDAAREVTGHDISVIDDERQVGDPPTLLGSIDKAQSELGWNPQFTELKDIVETAWKWHMKNSGSVRQALSSRELKDCRN